MKGVCLRFYMNEFQKHEGLLMYEWLLELAKNHGIKGGSAFRAIAGYGRHGIMKEEHFFELTSDVPVEVVFLLKKDEAIHFISEVKKNHLSLFCSMTEAEYGIIGEI